MPSSYTASARFVLQATGEGTNVWGTILNNGAFSLIDFAIAGVTTSSTATKTLTTVNGAADEARAAVLNYTGVTTGTWTIPSVSKTYHVRAATNDLILTNGSNSVTVVGVTTATVATDGTSVWIVGRSDFGGLKLTSVGTPTSNTDAATKLYVDNAAFASTLPSFPALPGNAGRVLTPNSAETNVGWILIHPDQTGKAGQFFKSLGANPTGDGPAGEWAYPINPAVTKTANYTAVNGDRLKLDTSAGAFNLTLPATPSANDRIVLMDAKNSPITGGWGTNSPTVLRNGSTIYGANDDYLLNVRGASVAFVYRGGTWEIELGNA